MRGHAQYIARFALEQIWAVRRFEKSSTRLTWALIIMTGILTALTTVLTYFTIVLAGRW
jgi:fluoride ion exporter CrcB/FEX